MSKPLNLNDQLLLLWGKTDKYEPQKYHPLLFHMLDVAAVCQHLLHRFGDIEELPSQWIIYLAALHDIGKADPLFQNKSLSLAESLLSAGLPLPTAMETFRHEARTSEWVYRHITTVHSWGRRAAKTVSAALHGHHGDFNSSGNKEDQDYPERFKIWETIRNELAESVASVLRMTDHPYSVCEFQNASEVGVRLSGLIVLSDWVASNDELYDYLRLSTITDINDYWRAACEESQSAVRRLAFDVPATERLGNEPLRFVDVWPECTVLRPAQAILEQECLLGIHPGLAIIEAPMGEGKTEAAIYLAEYWSKEYSQSGAYIALPTMATSNQMHTRYAQFLDRYHPEIPEPYLVHGMAWLMDDLAPISSSQVHGDDAEEPLSREWFQNAKRALLARDGVGTIDQALMSVLNVKHGFLRLLGLSTKVLIIDEVHAYDEYMTVLMEQLLRWCSALRVPVIMLSATLSHRQKERLVLAYGKDVSLPSCPDGYDEYPLLTFVPLDGDLYVRAVEANRPPNRRVEILRHPDILGNAEATARLAVEESREGGCICVLANTVPSAQAIFRELNELKPDNTQLHLFHARFTADRRAQIEETVVGLFGKDAGKDGHPVRPEKAILVATQVVEQSLDIDFDVMISELAPIDLLLQRCGRLHRHSRNERPSGNIPVLHVLLPNGETLDLGGTGHVYDHEPLLRTLILLSERNGFNLPQDFRPLIEGCYGDLQMQPSAIPEEKLLQAVTNRKEKLARHREEAGTHLIPEPNPRVFQLAEMTHPVNEGDEGARASYFRAQTRLGNDTCSVLVLSDPVLISVCRSVNTPDRETMRQLFMRKASIPDWWLRDVSAEDGFEAPFDGPRWLRGQTVIPMNDGVWRGRMNQVQVTIVDDEVFGLRIVKGDDDRDF